MQWLTRCAEAALALAVVLALYRVVRGPHTADRIVGLDVIAFAAIGLLAAWFVETKEAGLLEGALVLGAISFLSTVALSRAIAQPEAPADG